MLTPEEETERNKVWENAYLGQTFFANKRAQKQAQALITGAATRVTAKVGDPTETPGVTRDPAQYPSGIPKLVTDELISLEDSNNLWWNLSPQFRDLVGGNGFVTDSYDVIRARLIARRQAGETTGYTQGGWLDRGVSGVSTFLGFQGGNFGAGASNLEAKVREQENWATYNPTQVGEKRRRITPEEKEITNEYLLRALLVDIKRNMHIDPENPNRTLLTLKQRGMAGISDEEFMSNWVGVIPQIDPGSGGLLGTGLGGTGRSYEQAPTRLPKTAGFSVDVLFSQDPEDIPLGSSV